MLILTTKNCYKIKKNLITLQRFQRK